MRRVVVTGIGLLTPLGQGTELTWKRILAGESGAGRISAFDVDGWACQVACAVPRVGGRAGLGAPPGGGSVRCGRGGVGHHAGARTRPAAEGPAAPQPFLHPPGEGAKP